MNHDERLNQVLAEYTSLQERQRAAPLDPAQQRRLEMLQDVVLAETALVDNEGADRLPRPTRAPVSLEVRFKTREDAGRAQSVNVGTGGIAVLTSHPLPQGTTLKLQLEVPGWRGPIVTDGTVAWSDAKSMGIAFTQLRPEDACRLKELVVESGSLIGRLRSALGRKAPPMPAAVAGGAGVLLCLKDDYLVDVASELLGLHGFAAFDAAEPAPGPRRIALVVADVEKLAEVPEAASHPLVVTNADGPAAAGRFTSRNPVTWLPAPTSAAKIVEAARRMLVAVPGAAARGTGH